MPRRASVGRRARSLPALLAGMALLALAGSARAATADEAALARTVEALTQRVQQLESRLHELERRVGAPAAATTPPAAAVATAPAAPLAAAPLAAAPLAAGQMTPEAALRLNWSKIERAQDQDAVLALLGEPTRKLKVDGRTVWYYTYPGLGVGSVFFTDAGRVSSRQSPFGWGG